VETSARRGREPLTAPAPPLAGLPILAALLNLGAVAQYAAAGFGWPVLGLWTGSLAVAVASARPFRAGRRADPRRILREAVFVLGLLLLAAPAYLLQIGQVPFQIVTDEIAILTYTRELLAAPVDPFGLMAHYYQLPSLVFALMGWGASALGGAALGPARLLHALCGVAIVLAAYAWLRAGWSRLRAAAGALILGANHALLGISRLAMRDNTALLAELGAFALLARGLRTGCRLRTLLGGMVGGLTWYTYYPSRVTMPLWMLGLAALWLWERRGGGRRQLFALGLTALAGMLLVVSPLVVSTLRMPKPEQGWQFAREQTLLTPEGRAVQQRWVRNAPVGEAVRANIRQGLSAFNNRLEDQSFTYTNPGHGFLDPLTGALVWVGLLALLLKIRGHNTHFREIRIVSPDLFAGVGLVALWLAFALVINKAPNYTRLLVALPFVAYCALTGLTAISRRFAWLGVIAILGWNAAIFGDYVAHGYATQQEVGRTGRYLLARAAQPPRAYCLITSPAYPYYWWGHPTYWRNWIGLFAGPGQSVDVISPLEAITTPRTPPLTLLMTRPLWLAAQPEWRRLYPGAEARVLTPTASHVAVEVP
jgi:4-amino-4-deoxy-L-arabinose transferase-like glycosyltransferase